jgi:hemoglobin
MGLTMSRTKPTEHRNRDLDTHDEIAEFVTRFYREIAQEERFHHWFETIAHVDWHAHTLELTDFWVGVLLGEPHESADEVIEAHRWLHESDPFDTALFDRWLEIFDTTLDDGWTGPTTEAARRRGHGIAWAMAKRLTGHAGRQAS